MMESTQEHFIDTTGGAGVSAPSPVDAPESEVDHVDERVKQIGALEDTDMYRAAREDQQAIKRGDEKFYNSPERVKASWEREAAVQEKLRAETARVLANDPQAAQEQRDAERAAMRYETRREIYEQTVDPHFTERTYDTVSQISGPASVAIAKSPLSCQIVERIHEGGLANWINSLSPHDLAICIAEFEVEQRVHAQYAGRRAPQQPQRRTVSSAPRPPSTVDGKAHSGGKSPDEMSTDEYRAWRRAQIRAKEARR